MGRQAVQYIEEAVPMPRIVRGALLQATWTGDKEAMIQKHEGYAPASG